MINADRTDVAVVSVDNDEQRISIARQASWPPWVDLRLDDAVRLLPELGRFDLIFADAEGGKWA